MKNKAYSILKSCSCSTSKEKRSIGYTQDQTPLSKQSFVYVMYLFRRDPSLRQPELHRENDNNTTTRLKEAFG